MNDQPEDQSANPVAVITDVIGDVVTNIPAPLRKSLMKAAGRLLFGAVEVPAAALEAKAKDIKHRQAMREKLRAAVTKAAITRLSEHPEIAERALESFVSDLLGKQEAREEVLRYAAEELQQLPVLSPPSDAPSGAEHEMDDDWLSGFSSYAEKASSERLRQLFGRVLAGEIRQPNSYSLFTLDLLSKLGKKEAELIVRVAPFILMGTVVFTPRVRALFDFSLQSQLGDIGIVTAASIGAANAERTLTIPSANMYEGKYVVAVAEGAKVILFSVETPKAIKYDCAILTATGAEILSLHVTDMDEEMLRELASHLSGQGAEVSVADLVEKAEGRLRFQNVRKILPIATLPTSSA